MVLPSRLLLTLLAISVLSSLHAADWPAYLNGNDRDGYTSADLSPDLHLAWVHHSQARPELAWSGPRETPIEGHVMKHRVDFDASMQVVIGGNRAYYGSMVDHRLYCLETTTGKPLWTFDTEGPIRLAPTLAHGNVYFGSDDGTVYCLRADNGDVVWKMRIGPKDDRLLSRGEMISRWPVRTGVLIDGDIAYFGAGVFPHEVVYLVAANAKSGEVIWKNDRISQDDAGRNDLSPQGYLLANQEFLYVPSGRSLPVGVSRQTGEIVFQRKHSWRTTAGGVVGGTKALLGDGQVYSGGPHHFLAMEEKTGNVGESFIGGRQMVLTGEYAYLLDGEKIFAVNRAEHARASQEKQEWFLRAQKDRGDAAKLKEANAKMKEYAGVGIIWQYPSDYDGALIATDSLLVAGGTNGVVVLDRKTGAELWKAEVQGTVKGLSATENLLTVSTDAGLIYGFVPTAADTVREWPAPYTPAFADDEDSEFFRNAAKEILERSGQQSGYCLIAGNEQGRLAWELARQSQLTILAVEPDPAKVSQAQAALSQAGLHATRVTVIHAPLNEIPFSNYFANLIVSESYLRSGKMPCEAADVARFLKPCGGVAVLGGSKVSDAASIAAAADWMTKLYLRDEGELLSDNGWHLLRRGKLPGAGDWTHQYGNAANTSFTADQRIRDGLGVLWYGDPGPSVMINRHEAAGAPLSTNGRMFIQGTDKVMAYDAYNGTFLWDYDNPGAVRTGVFNNRETHNLAAVDDVLYVAVGNKATGLDAATGRVVQEFKTPDTRDGVERAWAYIACDGGQLFGSSTIRRELEARLRRRGLTVDSQTDAVFAMDPATGRTQWTYRGANILHTTIALGPDHIFFIDSSISPEERQELYRREKPELQNLSEEEAKAAEAEMKKLDVRLAVALDRRTGEKIWERPVNVTDTTDISAGGGSLTVMYADGCLVLCGANANGHYWKQFLSGEFEKRKLIVLDAKNGDELWSKNANYMNRPAVIEGQIFAEPWAFDLRTGEPKTRNHPLTGEKSEWQFSRPGHHCGVITATPNMMFFRSGFIGYYDLYEDSGTRHFSGQRLGCWINAIPGNGLVMIPEASAGCVCQFSIASTVVLEPKSENHSWGILSAVGASTPVRRLGINFGAPGDRKDLAMKEWFGYPRPLTVGRLEYVFNLQPKLQAGGGWYSNNPESLDVRTKQAPWLFASGVRGLEQLTLPLLGEGDAPASYDVRLYFANMSAADVESVEISFGGQPVSGVTQSTESSGEGQVPVVVREYHGIPVSRDLQLTVTSGGAAIDIAAMEVVRVDGK
ncbi:MAG: PQQ-binding-like beta-propeller repeat protein [Planctomycetaceae bacterium]|nr:PQQ-binding-like beta-propeller repeat protein [Planctomycetaceae bacterium]